MIRNVLTILAGILLLTITGTVWSLAAVANLSTTANWQTVAVLGAAGALALLGAPWGLCFLWTYTRPKGHHRSVIVRNSARYIKPYQKSWTHGRVTWTSRKGSGA